MSDKPLITSSFYKQLTFIGAIVLTTLGGVKYALNEFKVAVRAEMRPLVERVEKLEESYKEQDQLLAVNTPNINAVYASLEKFLNNYNRIHHTEFLRPSEISVTNERKRK